MSRKNQIWSMFLALFCLAVSAHAETAASELMKAQLPLVLAADELNVFLREASLESGTEYPKGFSSIEIDVQAGLVMLYWKLGADLPSAVAKVVSQLDARAGVRVRVERSAFDLQEMLSEMEKIVADGRGYPELRLAELGPLSGGTGIRVEVEDSESFDLNSHPVFAKAHKRLVELSGTGRAQLDVSKGYRKIHFSRSADYSPYWGGARILLPGTGCTSGFAIGNIWGEKAMLTAGHCSSRSNDVVVTNGVGSYMGKTRGAVQASNGQVLADSVRVTVSDAAGRIYDGFGPNETSKAVKGWGDSYVGQYVCTSGSYSGTRCDIRVEQTNTWWYDSIGIQYVNAVRSKQINHLNAAGQGDSGGPVFILVNKDYVDTNARGLISAGDMAGAPAQCTGVVATSTGGTRLCSWRIYFGTIRSHLDAQGMWLITG